LAVLRSYVDIAAEVMDEEGKSSLSGGELLAILDELEFDDDQPLQPMRQLHTFGGEMETTWTEWCHLLFICSYRDKIENTQELQAEVARTL
jgi:hypothetical protein